MPERQPRNVIVRQRVDRVAALVLPDLEHRRADVAVAIEVDGAERPLVVHVLARAEQLDRLVQRQERDLRARRARDRTKIRLDPRRRGRARLHCGEERDVRRIHRSPLEAGVRLRAGDVLLPVGRERLPGRPARSARGRAAQALHGIADLREHVGVADRLGHEGLARAPLARADERRRELLERVREVDDHPPCRVARRPASAPRCRSWAGSGSRRCSRRPCRRATSTARRRAA